MDNWFERRIKMKILRAKKIINDNNLDSFSSTVNCVVTLPFWDFLFFFLAVLFQDRTLEDSLVISVWSNKLLLDWVRTTLSQWVVLKIQYTVSLSPSTFQTSRSTPGGDIALHLDAHPVCLRCMLGLGLEEEAGSLSWEQRKHAFLYRCCHEVLYFYYLG